QVPLFRHLGQEQSPATELRNHQPMLPDLDVLGSDRKHRREHADLNLQLASFNLVHRTESRVFSRCCSRRFQHGLKQWLVRHYVPKTAPQLSSQVQGRECTTKLTQARRYLWHLEFLSKYPRPESFVS